MYLWCLFVCLFFVFFFVFFSLLPPPLPIVVDWLNCNFKNITNFGSIVIFYFYFYFIFIVKWNDDDEDDDAMIIANRSVWVYILNNRKNKIEKCMPVECVLFSVCVYVFLVLPNFFFALYRFSSFQLFVLIFFCLIFFSFSFVAVKIFSILMVLKFTLFSFPLQIKTSYTRNFFFSIIPHIKYEPKKKINKNEFCHIDTNVDNHQFIINIVIMFYGNNIGST